MISSSLSPRRRRPTSLVASAASTLPTFVSQSALAASLLTLTGSQTGVTPDRSTSERLAYPPCMYTATRSRRINWPENSRFWRSAMRLRRCSAALMASTLVGFDRRMPSASAGMSVALDTIMAMVSSMSEYGVMLAWLSCWMVGTRPSSSRLTEFNEVRSRPHLLPWNASGSRPRNQMRGAA